MMDQSILRAHRDRDDSIEKERRARVAKMMNKIYEARITTKEKPFIHTMYENYHQKFCKKFKGMYMQQARLAYQKAVQQGGLSKVFGKQSAISDHPPSASSDSSNILENLNHEIEKKSSSSQIRAKQINKVEFASEVKTQAKVKQMMKKKAPQEAQIVPKMKEEPKNKQEAAQQKKSLVKQINEIPRIQTSKQVQREVKKQEMPNIQIVQATIVKKNPVSQILIVKKLEQPKAQIKSAVRQQPIKPNVNEDEEQQYVQQDSGPSIYDLQKTKLKQIDDPVKHVTSSQILPSKHDKSDIHAKSHIASHQPDKQQYSKDPRQDKDLKEISKKQKVDNQDQRIIKISVDTERIEQKKQVAQQVKKQEVVIESQAKNEDKIIDPPLQEQKAVEKQIKNSQYVPILQQLRQQLQDSSSQAQGQQESALTLFTQPEADCSKQEIPQTSVDQAEPEQLSTEIKSQHQNNHDKNEEQMPLQQMPKVSPQKTQSEDSDKPQIEKKMELASRDQTEITSKMEPMDILERQEPVQKIQRAEKREESHQFNDDIENRIDRIVNSFQDWLNKELPPCEKCSKKEEESQHSSQKNSSDDDQ